MISPVRSPLGSSSPHRCRVALVTSFVLLVATSCTSSLEGSGPATSQPGGEAGPSSVTPAQPASVADRGQLATSTSTSTSTSALARPGVEDDGAQPQALGPSTTTSVDAPAAAGESVELIEDRPGRGALARDATCVALDVTLTHDDGRPVDAPAGLGPMVVSLDNPRLIRGLRQGVADMGVGGIRSIRIPPSLGYGQAGWPDAGIGPDTTLRATIALVWAGAPPTLSWEALHDRAEAEADTMELTRGQGAELRQGSRAMLMIEAIDVHGDRRLESGWGECSPRILTVGSEAVPSWFASGLSGMRPGGSRVILAPEDDAQSATHQADAWVVNLVWSDD
ncbi:MAG: FKBP-type peptidyl-prolyl cis-trans isomerase [Microthrixaceae bacterium]